MRISTINSLLVGFIHIVRADSNSGLPEGKNTVKVSIINPTRLLNTPPRLLFGPEINGTVESDIPSFSALIEHQTAAGQRTRLLFDLGVREDWENLPPADVQTIQSIGMQITSLGDPVTQLSKNGIKPESINTVILSHSHFDHVGDLNRFPTKKTGVIVGPGFKAAYFPGYPNNPNSTLDQTGFDGRQVREFPVGKKTMTIASLTAVDYFGDGSFYLISAPGHDYGHLAALARTTKGRTCDEDTFIVLGGDCGHHGGLYKPTPARPLPKSIPNRQHLIDINPHHSATEPYFYPVDGGFNLNATAMARTLVSIKELDANPNVLTVVAHDHWLLGVVDLFPKSANDWKRKGWGEDKNRFLFVKDFA